MEHEVYVPFPLGVVRSALADPERLARCVAGFQPDAPEGGAEETPDGDAVLAGRMRVRVGGSTITYRGSAHLVPQGPGTPDGHGGCTVAGEGTEVRGSGSVRLDLTIRTLPAGDGAGTTLACTAEVSGDGRIKGFEPRQRESAGRRLLDRFGSELAVSLAADAGGVGGTDDAADALGVPGGVGGIGGPEDNEPVIPNIPAPESPDAAAPAPEEGTEPETGRQDDGDGGEHGEHGGRGEPDGDGDAGTGGDGARPAALFDVEVPPPSLDPLGDGLVDDPVDEFADESAEAAHARRSMIGRSAEEVDHAPPRGRYAPVPPPERAAAATAALRWAATAAALAMASAVVVRRVVRRRR